MRALPIDYLAAGAPGVVLGYYWADCSGRCIRRWKRNDQWQERAGRKGWAARWGRMT